MDRDKAVNSLIIASRTSLLPGHSNAEADCQNEHKTDWSSRETDGKEAKDRRADVV